jgi:hypothetical protein
MDNGTTYIRFSERNALRAQNRVCRVEVEEEVGDAVPNNGLLHSHGGDVASERTRHS